MVGGFDIVEAPGDDDLVHVGSLVVRVVLGQPVPVVQDPPGEPLWVGAGLLVQREMEVVVGAGDRAAQLFRHDLRIAGPVEELSSLGRVRHRTDRRP